MRERISRSGGGRRAGPAAYRLTDFDRLLDAWVRADDFKSRVERVEYSVLASDPMAIVKSLQETLAGEVFALTQWIGAWLRKPYTTPPVVSVYVPAEVVSRFELGRRVEGGGNLWLLVPKDRGVFQGQRAVSGLPVVSDSQIYLDLVASGLRGPEAAEALREWEEFAK